MIETERITFPDGAWWEIKKQMTVGIQNAILNSNKEAYEVIKDAEGKPVEVKLNESKINWTQSSDIIAMAATVAWSYGPKTQEIFENEIPAEHYNKVKERIQELYIAPFLAPKMGSG